MTARADFYKTLQVDPEAEVEIIAVAYKRLAAKYHPDVNPSPDAGRRMRELNAAFEVLSDPVRRADYDARRCRAASRTRKAPRTSASRPVPAEPSLVVSPHTLSFGRVRKGASPSAILEVAVTEGRTLFGEVRTTHPWIRLSASRLYSDRTAVQVIVDTKDLEEGRHYAGAVVIDSVVFGLRTVPVSVNVAATAKPVLRVSPTYLDFGEVRFGQPPKVIELTIANSGPGYLTGSLRPRASWLSVSHVNFAGNSETVQVMASADGLETGRSYSSEVEIDSNGGKGLIVARLDVAPYRDEPSTPRGHPSRDLTFLQERLTILERQAHLSDDQQQERNIILYLLRACHGGDVADMLQKGIAAAQGAEGIGWRDDKGVLQGATQAVTVLGALLERLRRWEAADG